MVDLESPGLKGNWNRNVGEDGLTHAASRTFNGNSVHLLLEGNGIGQRSDLQRAILEQFGYDYHSSPPLNYPYDQYLAIVEFLRETLYVKTRLEKTPDETYQELGCRAIQTYFQGLSGSVLKMAARVMGPQRGAIQFLKNIKLALPWGEHELVAVRAGYVCYRKRGVSGPPALMLGIMQASLEATGVKLTRLSYKAGPTSDLADFATDFYAEDIIYEVEWV